MNIKTALFGVALVAIVAPIAFAQPAATGAKQAPKAGGAAAPVPAGGSAGGQPRPIVHAPAIPGICVFSRENLAADSKLGAYVDQRLGQIQTNVAAQLNQASQNLDANARNVQALVNATGQAANQQAITDIQRQAQQFADMRTDLQDRFDRTTRAALTRIFAEGESFLQQVYEQHRCTILLDGNAVRTVNPSMDLTPDVVKLLDAQTTELQFDLLPTQAQPAPGTAPAAGATPAAAAPAASAAPAGRGAVGPRP